jgi:hypothetical protein
MGFDRGSDLAAIPGGLGKLEVGEVVAVADEDGMDGDENSAAAEAADENEAGFVEEVMDLIGKESDAEDVGELVGGDKAIEHQQGVRRDQPDMELVGMAFGSLVLVMTEEGNHSAIHEAGIRDVKELAGCTDSSADEEQEDMKLGLTGLKHVRGGVRDSGVEVDLAVGIGRRRELVEIDELLGWDAGHDEDDLVQIGVPWIPVDAWQAQSH